VSLLNKDLTHLKELITLREAEITELKQTNVWFKMRGTRNTASLQILGVENTFARKIK
jgi:hypothetical protein